MTSPTHILLQAFGRSQEEVERRLHELESYKLLRDDPAYVENEGAPDECPSVWSEYRQARAVLARARQRRLDERRREQFKREFKQRMERWRAGQGIGQDIEPDAPITPSRVHLVEPSPKAPVDEWYGSYVKVCEQYGWPIKPRCWFCGELREDSQEPCVKCRAPRHRPKATPETAPAERPSEQGGHAHGG